MFYFLHPPALRAHTDKPTIGEKFEQVLSLEEAVANAQKERDMLKATLRGHGLKVKLRCSSEKGAWVFRTGFW